MLSILETLDEWLPNDTELRRRIKKMKQTDIERHPLFKRLLQSRTDTYPADIKLIDLQINTIDKNIQQVMQLQNYSNLIKRIFSPENFQGAINELDNICFFIDKGYKPILEPRTPKNGKMEFKVKLDNRYIYFECTSLKQTSNGSNVGMDDIVNKNGPYALEKLLEKASKKQIIPNEANILLIETTYSKKNVEEGKMIDKFVVILSPQCKSFFNTQTDYIAILIYNKNPPCDVERWLIPNKNHQLKLTEKEIKILDCHLWDPDKL